ncbi:hypothetical protein [Paraburkholderia caballeronis]|uniref:Uncharacterized protein n=1 Tax=Paraburkholderia caballeronis TaxID=416943 RepID=A0A1H7G516_9BURK|nr:hypothetical protein [Paraburkholderia caballeronis]PXW24698.1 hypothetical protein C7403_10618 [Paraburkholderia caballeronis]PXX00428.1 hypothetical protein C7407_10618 [Paraburkholderia caballeronis]RAJ98491.1 hypothetical protein C7409_10618 [Paraburkholderia caballeronis]TDV16688.1 hypothetical protein C7408_105308 [Paraburkholderia caballeronis]TDV19084.1 hypothetical protein C7406_104354 [Paraburkholderia caballeronis]
MDRIFMTREEAIHLLLEAHKAASGQGVASDSPDDDAFGQLHTIDRLLLDVRAGRVDEFHFGEDSAAQITITD